MENQQVLGGAGMALSARKPRADARRNREMIVQVAKAAFTEKGAGASLDDIAKKAGVGAGTLYRHFPNRESLLVAVYQAEVDTLASAAGQLSLELTPVEALRAWLHLFIEHLATKKIIVAALIGLLGSYQVLEEHMSKVRESVEALYGRAIDAGDIRPDIHPLDHVCAIVGATFFATGDDWKESATRLVDILLLGSRPFGS